jgi:hypothetical protein
LKTQFYKDRKIAKDIIQEKGIELTEATAFDHFQGSFYMNNQSFLNIFLFSVDSRRPQGKADKHSKSETLLQLSI